MMIVCQRVPGCRLGPAFVRWEGSSSKGSLVHKNSACYVLYIIFPAAHSRVKEINRSKSISTPASDVSPAIPRRKIFLSFVPMTIVTRKGQARENHLQPYRYCFNALAACFKWRIGLEIPQARTWYCHIQSLHRATVAGLRRSSGC